MPEVRPGWSVEDVSLHQIAVWQSGDQNWLVTPSSVAATAVLVDRAKAYFAGLIDDMMVDARTAGKVAFGVAPGKMAVFEVEKEGRREAVGVKLLSYRTLPLLSVLSLSANTKQREIAEAHPLLAAIILFDGEHYHRDTPMFRDACAALGFDPDCGRPRFRSPYEAFAEELLCWVSERFDAKQWLPDGYRFENDFLFDVLDLMRADLRPSPSLLERARQRWSKLDLSRLPDAGALARLLFTEELLCIGDEQHRANGEIGLVRVGIDFLPSQCGAGCSATISGFFGDYDSEGWVDAAYAHLRGVVVEPASERVDSWVWLSVVRRRLSEQGVIFISQEKVSDYMKTERVYWIKYWGGSDKWRGERTATWIGYLMWWLRRRHAKIQPHFDGPRSAGASCFERNWRG